MKLVFTGLIALCTVAATFGNSYAYNYRGQCFTWGLEFFTEAVEACARHEARIQPVYFSPRRAK
jgi:hypothetical protein